MNINANDRTLGLINIWQVLRKLFWEIELIKATPDSLRVGAAPVDVLHVQDARLYATINAAFTSLALVDWLYHTIREDQLLTQRIIDTLGNVDMSSDKAFLLFFREKNSSINACHQISNANKHFYLKNPERNFKVMVGEIVMKRPDGTTDVAVITHIIRNGDTPDTATSVFDMLVSLMVWWEDLLTNIQVLGREQFFPQGAP